MVRRAPRFGSDDSWNRLQRDRKADHDYHDGRQRGKRADHGTVEPRPAESTPCEHRDEADPRDGCRQADAERDDQREPERKPVERDRAQQDDERRRAGQQSRGDADPEDSARRQLGVVCVVAGSSVVVAVVVVCVVVVVPASPSGAHPPEKDAGSHADHEEAQTRVSQG